MITEELQFRVHRGERDAFQTLYSENAKGVYLKALAALADENCAKEAVKRVFSSVYRELRAATGPTDLDARIAQLTDDAIADLKLYGLPAPTDLPPVPEESAGEAPVAAEPAPVRRPDPLPPPPPKHRRAPSRGKKRRRGSAVPLTLLVILLTLIILWMVCGILMDLGVLPFVDLGYGWFNGTVYPLFSLGGSRL